MARIKFPQVTTDNLTSTLTLLILCVQVVLLVVLSTRIGRLEKMFATPPGGYGIPLTPVVVERTPDERGWSIGPDTAEMIIVEFSDFECPYCADANQSIKDLLAKYPSQVRFVYRHFPLTGIHSNAFQTAEASECAGEQEKFWEMHDILFANQSALDEESLFRYADSIGLDMDSFTYCMASRKTQTAIEQDIADGQKYGVNGTPTFFLNNKMFMSLSELEDAVQEALTKP